MHTVAKVSRACKARVNSQSDFSIRIFRMSFLLLRARRKIVPLLPLGVLGGLGAKREEKIEFVMEFEIQFF